MACLQCLRPSPKLSHLTLKEFTKALGVLEPSAESSRIESLFQEIDDDGDGKIDIEEFIQSMSTESTS